MFCLTKPNRETIFKFISAQKDQPFSYSHIDCSRGKAPNGYNADHNRVKLGEGLDVFERAKAAIRAWKMFDMPWIELCWPNTPIKAGATVAVLVSHLGFWSLNACRIVYSVEERGKLEKYGFAYGTLPGHRESGEELFIVEHDGNDDAVWYDIYAVSRPNLMARLAYPYTRALQKRFARDSMAAMQKFVSR